MRIGKEEYRNDIKRLRMFLEGNRTKLLNEMRQEMAEASTALRFEQAARLRGATSTDDVLAILAPDSTPHEEASP